MTRRGFPLQRGRYRGPCTHVHTGVQESGCGKLTWPWVVMAGHARQIAHTRRLPPRIPLNPPLLRFLRARWRFLTDRAVAGSSALSRGHETGELGNTLCVNTFVKRTSARGSERGDQHCIFPASRDLPGGEGPQPCVYRPRVRRGRGSSRAWGRSMARTMLILQFMALMVMVSRSPGPCRSCVSVEPLAPLSHHFCGWYSVYIHLYMGCGGSAHPTHGMYFWGAGLSSDSKPQNRTTCRSTRQAVKSRRSCDCGPVPGSPWSHVE